jgi:hypothetical protein
MLKKLYVGCQTAVVGRGSVQWRFREREITEKYTVQGNTGWGMDIDTKIANRAPIHVCVGI